MKRALFVFGIVLAIAGAALLAYLVYAKVYTDTLLHVTAGMMAAGAIIAAFIADSKPFLALIDRIIAWKRGSTPAP